jgi:hypothetical protein
MCALPSSVYSYAHIVHVTIRYLDDTINTLNEGPSTGDFATRPKQNLRKGYTLMKHDFCSRENVHSPRRSSVEEKAGMDEQREIGKDGWKGKARDVDTSQRRERWVEGEST